MKIARSSSVRSSSLLNIISGLKCHNTWDGQTAGYECEKPERMFVLQSGGERGQFGPYKLHQFDLEEKHGKATRFGLLTIVSYIMGHSLWLILNELYLTAYYII